MSFDATYTTDKLVENSSLMFTFYGHSSFLFHFLLFSSKVEKSLLHYSPEYRCNTILIDLKTRYITNRLTFDSRIYYITSPLLTGLRVK